MRRLILVLATLMCACSVQSKNGTYSYEQVAKGLSVPWGIAFTDDRHMLVTERTGNIKLIDVTTGEVSHLFTVPSVADSGQGGLLDIAVSPHSPSILYMTYSKPTPEGPVTALATASFKQNRISEFRDLFVSDSASDTSRHFGSRITFDDKNHLYFSIGDRGERDNSQDTSNHSGSILRLDMEGRALPDNPYADEKGFRQEIWSYGHRNPQGLYFDSKSQALWSIEHGPRGGDEINLIHKGANYGWPVTSHGKEYWGPVKAAKYTEKEGIESPKLVYVPSIAPGSLILYRGSRYPDLDGKLLAGALKLTHINVVEIKNDGMLEEERRIASELNQRIRDITVSPAGDIYFSTDNGNIYRLVNP